jgi:hypothetical protein
LYPVFRGGFVMDQMIEMLKGFGAASPLLAFLWFDRKEKREDIASLRAENARMQGEVMTMLKESIKADITNTLVLEKIADKVGAS